MSRLIRSRSKLNLEMNLELSLPRERLLRSKFCRLEMTGNFGWWWWEMINYINKLYPSTSNVLRLLIHCEQCCSVGGMLPRGGLRGFRMALYR
jgi:hypothetical protein